MTGAPFIGFHAAAEQFAPAEIVELGVAAEEAGFEGFSISDHLHPWQDNQGHAAHAWMTLAAIGARTRRLLLGTAVNCPTYRYHPALVAHAFATLGALYPGRVFLGLGTGEALNEQPTTGEWGPYSERAERLTEAIHLIRRLWSEEFVDFDGKYYRAEAVRIYDKPAAPVPIYVAASGPRSARIAGREADGWITDPATARGRPDVRDSFFEGAREAGRDASTLARIVELWLVAGERDEALEAARLWQFLPVFNEVVDVADPRQVQRVAEERSSPEKTVAGWLVSADPGEHVAAIGELAELGATHIFIHSPQRDQGRVIEFYGRQVLPRVRP
ncbi:MAG: TIGR03557 family F420-dependent LLM class oxidoreductase [Dehalococcoidia bacterium]